LKEGARRTPEKACHAAPADRTATHETPPHAHLRGETRSVELSGGGVDAAQSFCAKHRQRIAATKKAGVKPAFSFNVSLG
jgi:hypothetical protein